MSIFTLPVHSVENTRIYASSSEGQPDRQLTVISHTIETIFEHNTCIIPVPHPHSVELHRSEPGTGLDFLEQLENAFDRGRHSPRVTPPFFSPERMGRRLPRGEYHMVFVGTKQEFQEFNSEHQIAHPDLCSQLLSLYRENYWGFLVATIQEGYYEYEPLVYTHKMVGTRLFLPTLHHYPETMKDQVIQEESDRWNHTLFLNGTYRQDDPQFQEVNPMRLNRIPWGVLPNGFQYALRDLVMKKINRYGPNVDTTADSRIQEAMEGRRLWIDE